MQPAPLPRIAVERNLIALRAELGQADQKRLAALLPLIADDRRIRFSDALAALYPHQQRDAALTAFRQMRARLATTAQEASLALALEADTQTRAAPTERWCWFTGEDRATEAATSFAEAETRGTLRIGQDAVQVSKRTVRYFISYAHADAPLKNALLQRLKPWLDSASDYAFVAWQDRDILVGKDWHAEIQAAIKDCDFGLLLVSPQFLASPYITREELQHFVAPEPFAAPPSKPAVPVALRTLRFDGKIDMKGLERRQFFHDGDGKAFQERSTDKTQHDFCNELFGAIVRRLDEHFATPPASAAPPPKRPTRAWQRDELAHELEDLHFVTPHGHTGTMNKLEDEAPPGERRDALQFLLDWSLEQLGPTCCALLGSVGIGKTTTCKAFTYHLLEQRETDPTLPLPIYLDLRHVGDAARQEPDLKAILATVLRRSWQGGQTEAPLDPDEVIRLVRQEAAVVIFDGLDEVLVHLSQRSGQYFTRELLRILPPALWPGRRKPDEPGRPGRVLVTCRTHYFRSLRDQQTHLTAEDRDDVRDSDYRVFVLLPFTDEQVRDYLKQSFPQRDVDPILATIHAVHNLAEMASQPYTLSLIAHALPQIERWNIEGKRVTGVDLYRHMVQSWLERDAGKHELETDHKQQIMEHVAAQLWRSGSRTWTARQMEDWLTEFLDATPSIGRHYRGKDLNLLKKDLRTATFLVGGGRQDFRFAHTSLQEFFLAAYLLRALQDGRIEDWDMARPSRETLDFLGQMLLGEADDAAMATLRAMRAAYRPRISELAFDYTLFALARSYPAPSPAGFVLDGGDLREWTIEAATGGPLLNLRSASFRGARLGNAVFRHVDLDGADFSAADLLRAELNGGRARGGGFENAVLAGTVFRALDLTGAVFAAALTHRTQFLFCALDTATGLDPAPPMTLLAGCKPAGFNNRISKQKAHLAALGGHGGSVQACAFSPDGTRIASASWDKTLRLWDAASGDCLMTLQGHDDAVQACAFSPDGTRIASASYDNTLRLWDAASGDCLMTLQGHDDPVQACAFSPDGTRIASASYDNTIRLWDAASGDCLMTSQGHDNWVQACAFSPDGTRIASASHDNTIRLWDAASGDCLMTLQGHDDAVQACAFSPDGTRIASASDDKTIRLWDAASGDCLMTLQGHHNPVQACAFSPNGTRIASASNDNTIRLWDAASGDCLMTLHGHEDPVQACAFSPDGSRIASASLDNTIRLWDAASGDCLMTLHGHHNRVLACAFSPDGSRIASASYDNTIRLWDAASGDCLMTLQGHRNAVQACAFSPDGSRIASASDDKTIRLWDAASGDCLMTLHGHHNRVRACAFSPDGSRIASASDDKTIRLWDAASGDCLMTLHGHEDPVQACAFSPDGSRIASASLDNTIRLWDAASGDCLMTLQGHDDWVLACAFSPDGSRIASASNDNTIRLWDAASGACLMTLQGHHNSVLACAFSADGSRIASASYDKSLRLWDAASGDCLMTLHGHEDPVQACAFSPDGSRIASASRDNTLRLWDAVSGAQIAFRVHLLGDGEFVSMTLDGQRVIQVSPEAWRDLGWLVPDATGALTRYPAEVFGPLPEYRG